MSSAARSCVTGWYVSAGSSGYPVDRLIRRTILTGYRPTDSEIQATIQHIVSAPFARHQTRIDPYYAQLAIRNGFHVPSHADSLTAHIAKHVWAQEQWVVTTTEAEYLEDIRAAIVADTSRLIAFHRSRCPVMAILTAYMVAGIQDASIPAGALWLTSPDDQQSEPTGYSIR